MFFRVAANVFSLCVRAGLEALSCQPALMPNRSTKLELTTSARMTQNECYGLPFFNDKTLWAEYN